MIVSEPLVKSWIVLQRRLIAGLRVAHVDLHGAGVSNGGLSLTLPESPRHQAELALAAELAQRSGAPVTGNANASDGESLSLRIAYPLRLGDHAQGAMVIEVAAPLEQQAEIIRLLGWSEAWLRLALDQGDESPDAVGVAELVKAGSMGGDYQAAQTAVLAAACNQSECTRIALGDGGGADARLLAVSDAPELARRGSRAKAIERAMQEALETGKSCCWSPAGGKRQGETAQRDLAEQGGLAGVCTVPVSDGLRRPRVFVFEYAADRVWSEPMRVRCEQVAGVAALVLELRAERDAPWLQRLRALLRDGLHGLIGPAGRARRIAAAAAVLVLVVLAFSKGDYRISAPAVIEGVVQRAVVAPFDGYVQYASVRAGQQVREGEQLASLEDRDLRNERSGLLAERTELSKQHGRAISVLDHTEAKVLEAQLERVQAELALVEDQLERTRLRAPLDGLVISGDLTRSLGVPVSRGQLLFEIAPMHGYRVAIEVSDRDISHLAAGQAGELILTALPRRPVRLSVTGVTTLAPDPTVEPAFRVEAMLAEDVPELRPGMEGTAKISVGERRRWWIWTHALTDWLRLQLWRWLP